MPTANINDNQKMKCEYWISFIASVDLHYEYLMSEVAVEVEVREQSECERVHRTVVYSVGSQ